MQLLKSQRQEIHSTLGVFGHKPEDFVFTSERSELSPPNKIDVLTHRGTSYFFRFEFLQGAHYAIHSPGDEMLVNHFRTEIWGAQFAQFTRWCGYLERELKATDPWAEIEAASVSMDFSWPDETPNSPFFIKERAAVSKTLDAIESLLLDFSRENKEAQKAIRAEIEKLRESADTQDRKSWFYTVVGFIASSAVSLALAPAQTKQVYEVLRAGLYSVIKLIQ